MRTTELIKMGPQIKEPVKELKGKPVKHTQRRKHSMSGGEIRALTARLLGFYREKTSKTLSPYDLPKTSTPF